MILSVERPHKGALGFASNSVEPVGSFAALSGFVGIRVFFKERPTGQECD